MIGYFLSDVPLFARRLSLMVGLLAGRGLPMVPIGRGMSVTEFLLVVWLFCAGVRRSFV